MAEDEHREARLPRRRKARPVATGEEQVRIAPVGSTRSRSVAASEGTERKLTIRFEGSAPPWRRGAYRALLHFRWVAGVVIPWAIIGYLELTSPDIYEPVTMIFAAVLFILTLPLGLVLRIDSFLEWAHFDQSETALVLILPIVLANFVLIGAVKGWLGAKASRREIEK